MRGEVEGSKGQRVEGSKRPPARPVEEFKSTRVEGTPPAPVIVTALFIFIFISV